MNAGWRRVSGVGLGAGVAWVLAVAPAWGWQVAESHFETLPRHLGEDFLDGRGETFGRALAGEFTGDLRTDVVQMIGSTPTLFYGPGLYHAMHSVPVQASAMAVLPSGSREGRDALVVATPQGLRRCVTDDLDNGWDLIPMGSVEFADARALDAGDVDGDGTLDVVALTAAGDELLILLDVLGTPTETGIAIPGIATDVVLLNWEAGAPLEFGLVGDGGMGVMRGNGSFAFVHALGRSGDALVRLASPGAPDRMAVAASAGGSDAWLVVADAATGAEAPIPLGDIDVVGMAAGDVNMDGLQDLALSHRAVDELWFLTQQSGGGASFALQGDAFSTLSMASVPGPAPTNSAWPVLADLDQDGDTDLSFAVQSDEWISIFRGRAVDHVEEQPFVSGGSYTWDGGVGTGTLVLTVEEPASPLPNANHLHFVVWKQVAADAMTQREALTSRVVPLNGWPLNLTLTVGEEIGSPATRAIEIRLLDLPGGGGGSVKVGPTYVGGFATSQSALDQLLALFGLPLAQIIPLELYGVAFAVSSNLSDIGTGIVPLGEVPCFAEDDLPKPK